MGGTRLKSAVSVSVLAFALVLVLANGGAAGAAPAAPLVRAATAAASNYGIGASTLANPASGGEYVYVSTAGDDMVRPPTGSPSNWQPYSRVTCLNTGATAWWADQVDPDDRCPAPDASHPLRTIQAGIQVTDPGDVLVVRSGTYDEKIGWSSVPGTSSKPIVMQAHPGERVDVLGYLNLSNPSYWTISGFRFGYSAKKSTAEFIVRLAGGVSWTFSNNEVSGSRGVANLLIEKNGSSSPQNYRVAGNCIRDNQATDAHGLDHNIYLMTGVNSSGGVIEYNLLTGAPRGGNIKAGGNSDAANSPHDVQIRYNTVLNAASGVIVGQRAEGVIVHHNVIAQSLNSNYYDGAIKTYAMANPTANAFEYNLFFGYANQIRETGDVRVYVPTVGNVAWDGFAYTGSAPGCSVVLSDPQVAAHYGHRADPSAPHDPTVERLAGDDRFATSVKISQQFAPGVNRVYLATGHSYADALSAGPAAATAGGPLLLTLPTSLPDSVRAELLRLKPDEIVLVGGTAAISKQVEAAVKGLSFAPTVIRIAGSDRYDTSRKIAEFAFGESDPTVAYIASGLNFPDALAAGPAAGDAGGPVILVDGTQKSADSALKTLLDDLGVIVVKIAGGTSAVSSGIQSSLAVDWRVVRLAGSDRFGTANAINADHFKVSDGTTDAYLATGYSFADALAGSALAGAQGAPLYITQPNCVPSASVDAFDDLGVEHVVLLGGTSALKGGVAGLFSC
jgi:putative cell wall-binding protein